MTEQNAPFFLDVTAGEAQGKTIGLKQEPIVIGRQETCDLILPNDPLVSRQHARFGLEGSSAWVENLGSLNGVFVNRALISQRQAIKPGDQIIIGNHLFILRQQGATNQPVAKSAVPSYGTPANITGSPAHAKGSSIVGTGKPNVQDAIRRLYLLYQMQKATVNENTPEHLLRMILNLIFQDLRIERGCILLIHPHTQQVEPFAYKIRAQSDDKSLFQPRVDTVNLALSERASAILSSEKLSGTNLTYSMAIPLIESGHYLGVIYLDSTHKDLAIHKTDLEFLEALANLGAASLAKAFLEEKSKKNEEVIKQLEKHVGSEVAQIAREKKVDINRSEMETQEKQVTILFSDIAGFTSMSERLTPSEIAFLLNGYFNHMAECVSRHHGYLNKYIGDAVMAVFGAPQSMGNDAANAIHCAIDMLEKLKIFWKTIGEKNRFNIRIGINTGVVTAGNIGSLSRMEYTVIGDAVNLASRLESKAEHNSILIGENTSQYVKDLFKLQPLDTIKVKGKEQPVQVYKVLIH